ncbi:MAG: four helix bundle protein [Sulfuricella sp.]|nr:four helix bundle protein [Sulfuricella sp.]
MGLVAALPGGRAAEVIGKQLLRSATSVGANYRAACRAKSNADFISKMGTVEEEADECLYWMELLAEAKLVQPEKLQPLMAEADELVAITVSSINTAKARKT